MNNIGEGIGGAFGNIAGAAMYAQAQVARQQAQGARRAAAANGARAAVLSQTADELRRDVILGRLEMNDVQEQLDDARDELKAEQARTAYLMDLLVQAQAPSLPAADRAQIVRDGLADVRKLKLA